MSRDGTYILKYHPGVASNKEQNYKAQDVDIISKEHPGTEFVFLKYDVVFAELPKHTLMSETVAKLHCDQLLESCDGDDFVVKS